MLNGKKTYLVAVGVILAAAGSYLTGDANLSAAITAALQGLGLAALRAGVSANATK